MLATMAPGSDFGSLFASRGYGVVPSFLQPAEIRSFALLLKDALALAREPCMSRPGNDLIPLRWNDEITALMLGSARIEVLRRLLIAPDLKWLSGYISTKPAQTPALLWHQDWWCWDHPVSFEPAPVQVAVLCYLEDTSPRNGALRVLPGSHRESIPLHSCLPEPHCATANSIPGNHPAMSDQPGQNTVSVRAGDAVIVDYRLLHGTHANQTLADRNCILLSFIPNWRGLPVEIKAHLISHPALPSKAEASSLAAGPSQLFPRFDGLPVDLPLSRLPPPVFPHR